MTVARSVDDALYIRSSVSTGKPAIVRSLADLDGACLPRQRTVPGCRLPAAAGPELWMQRVRGFSTMNSRTRSLPAPIFIRFTECTLKTERFVFAVIPSRKRITQKISVRFARRPFRNNMRGPTPVIRKDIAWTISTCFHTLRSLSLSLQAIPQHGQWSTPNSQTGPRRMLRALQRHHREQHEWAAALGPSRADRPSHPPGRRH